MGLGAVNGEYDMRGNRHVARRLVAAGALALSAHGALADGTPGIIGPTDLQNQPDWTGFYIGGKLGGAWSNVEWTHNLADFPTTSASVSPDGFAGGVIGGGNVQVGRWVFGAEVSFSGMDLSQTSQPNATDTFKAEISWLTTIEGRIGLSFDNYLVFAKGGWAGGNAKLEMVTTSGTPATATETQFADGWTIGGGVELLCWSNVVLGLEYDYLDLSLSTAASCPLCDDGILAGTGPAITGDATMSSVMLRASYLFPHED